MILSQYIRNSAAFFSNFNNKSLNLSKRKIIFTMSQVRNSTEITKLCSNYAIHSVKNPTKSAVSTFFNSLSMFFLSIGFICCDEGNVS